MEQTAVILIFPPGISPKMATDYLTRVVATLPPPIIGSGPIEIGGADTFNPDHGTPVVYQP